MGSGIGSSACSAVAAVVAINELLGKPLSRRELYLPLRPTPFFFFPRTGRGGGAGMHTRRRLSAPHTYCTPPPLLGGMVLVRNNADLDLVNIAIPPELRGRGPAAADRADRRRPRGAAEKDPAQGRHHPVGQRGQLSFMSADYGLIGRSLHDVVAEPARAHLIPHFHAVKDAAMRAGALGCSISGAGPACFALCRGDESAFEVAVAMQFAFSDNDIPCERYISTINTHGAMRIK
ncbi:MAG: homoserine kinase [Kiritimatiellia bacterium]